jgi:hypothetical protein
MITNNTDWGIQLKSVSDQYMSSINNIIIHNNFINNQQGDGLDVSIPAMWVLHGGYVSGVGNIWDDGHEGNYWSDYKTRYPDASEVPGAGIWDQAWEINENNIDHCPLISPYTANTLQNISAPSPLPSSTGDPAVPLIIEVVLPENKTYTGSSVSLSFNVNQPVSWMGYMVKQTQL